MTMRNRALMPMCLVLGLAGCGSDDRVLFVTDTGIGMGYDTKPPNLSIDYHRFEGYLAPTYENGALPPVVARIQANLNIFTPKVFQTYATGGAAVLLTKDKSALPPELPLLGRSGKVGYFVTDSSIGLKVAFDGTTAEVPSAINLGYKRKEFSWIPVSTAPSGQDCNGKTLSPSEQANLDSAKTAVIAKTMPTATKEQREAAAEQLHMDCYGDTLATVGLDGTVDTPKTSGLQLDQFFATGTAARNLAATDDDIRNVFKNNLIKVALGTDAPTATAATGLVASLGDTHLKAGASVPLTVNVAAINDEPVTLAVTGATVAEVKVGSTPLPAPITTAVLSKAHLKAGAPLAVTFDLKDLAANTVIEVTWTGSSKGAAAVPIGDPIAVQ
jgi:hypothetical protein